MDAIINRRRIEEEHRKKRFFNAKQRQIGIDVDSLNYQIQAKKLQKAREVEQERCYAEQQRHIAELEHKRHEQEQEQIREQKKQVDEFRKNSQRPEHRRDYDLYDPDMKRKECPPRNDDEDDDCPVSNLQKFQGEDSDEKERRNAQKRQFRDQILQQIQEKRTRNFRQNKLNMNWESEILDRDNLALKISQMELEERNQKICQWKRENVGLANEYRDRMKRSEMEEELLKLKDVEVHENSDFLNEVAVRSEKGPNRILPAYFKGMTQKQLQEFRDGQLQQLHDKKLAKDREQKEEAMWHELAKQEDLTATEAEERKKLHRQSFEKILKMENEFLDQEQKFKERQLNKIVYTNVPTREYFEQFNTTSR